MEGGTAAYLPHKVIEIIKDKINLKMPSDRKHYSKI